MDGGAARRDAATRVRHKATVWHRCINPACEFAGRKIAVEIEVAHPAALLGVKITCPMCGKDAVWFKRAPAPAVGVRG